MRFNCFVGGRHSPSHMLEADGVEASETSHANITRRRYSGRSDSPPPFGPMFLQRANELKPIPMRFMHATCCSCCCCCCCLLLWLLLLATAGATVGHCCWLLLALLLVAAVGGCCWWMLLVVAASCCPLLLLCPAAYDGLVGASQVVLMPIVRT